MKPFTTIQGYIKNNAFLIANSIGFQIIWWVLILWGNEFLWPVAIALLTHIYFCTDRSYELKSILIYSTPGMILDSLLTHFNVFHFQSHTLIPIWLMALWITFACSLNHSMKWTFKSYKHLSFIGLLGLPLCYLASERMGVININVAPSFKYGVLFAHGTTYILAIVLLRKQFQMPSLKTSSQL